ncbi:hypothetical protein [Streptomyces sp. NPDC059122]|uniref:hypothetical protein n=1 Tax=unclassified Streptomyces TaxID=2593676 RepID=UPI00369884F1
MGRRGSVSAVRGAALLLVAGCEGGGGKPDGNAGNKALTDGVTKGCGGYLKPETVAAALGHATFANVNSAFRAPEREMGGCLVNITTSAGPGSHTAGPIAVYLMLEVYDSPSAASAAEFVAGACGTRLANGVRHHPRVPCAHLLF